MEQPILPLPTRYCPCPPIPSRTPILSRFFHHFCGVLFYCPLRWALSLVLRCCLWTRVKICFILHKNTTIKVLTLWRPQNHRCWLINEKKNKAVCHKLRTRNSISHFAKKKVKCDRRTDRPTDRLTNRPTDRRTNRRTDRPTQWLLESRARD